MKKKILITGASGFIGGFLVEKALEMGFDVYAGIRRTSSTQYLSDSQINLCYINFEDRQELVQTSKDLQFDYIIHNAGLTKSSDKNEYYKVNCDYLKNFIHAILEAKALPEKFIFMSSLAAYGPAEYTSDGLVKESSTPHPVTNYGRSKLKGEEFLKGITDFPIHIIRPTAVYGPREKDFLTVYQMLKKRVEIIAGFKKQKLTFIYVEDLVNAIFKVLLEGENNTHYFVADGHTHSVEELNTYVKSELGVKTLKLKLPIALIKFIGTLSEWIGKLKNEYPPLNREKVNEIKSQSWYCDTDPLLKLGWKPQTFLKEGIYKTIKWNKDQGYL